MCLALLKGYQYARAPLAELKRSRQRLIWLWGVAEFFHDDRFDSKRNAVYLFEYAYPPYYYLQEGVGCNVQPPDISSSTYKMNGAVSANVRQPRFVMLLNAPGPGAPTALRGRRFRASGWRYAPDSGR